MWFKVDDSFYDHPKAVGISNDALATWTRAGGWCGRHLTDGVMADPNMFVGDAPDPVAVIEDLIDRTLWERTEEGHHGGPLQFHDWADWNPTRADVLADRKLARDRRRRYLDKRRNDATGRMEAHHDQAYADDGVTHDSHRDGTVLSPVTPPSDHGDETPRSHLPDPTRPDQGRGGVQVGDQSSLRNARPRPNDGSTIELIRLTQALMRSATGQQVAAEDAADICTAVLSGRDVADPAAYLRTTLGDKRRARELLPTAAQPGTPTPPSTTTLCRRCQRTGHDAQHCPTLAPGTSPAHDGETATLGAKAARESLANRERPARSTQPTGGPELHGEALARAQAAASRAARLPETLPDAPPDDDDWPADDADIQAADDEADDADIPF